MPTEEEILKEWVELEAMQDLLQDAESKFYSIRSRFWHKIAKLKQLSPNAQTYKQFEGKVRRGIKKLKLGKRPRGMQLDHKTPVLLAFILGWTVEQTNDPSNLQMIKTKANRKKGLKRE